MPRRLACLATAAALFGLVLAGCALEVVGGQQEELVIPGDWNPPASTRTIAATQYVDVVNPPAVLPLGSCTSTNPWVGTCTHPACLRAHPGTSELDAYIRARWTDVRAGGTYSCRRNSNPDSTAYLSVHSVGRAIDLMIPTIGGDADNTAGDAVANWLIENAEYIGIQRVIWDGIYWNGERGFSEISDTRTSSGTYRTDHHVNHIHVELSVDGAARRTRFFTEGAPATTCPVVCYGTAAVRADCSFVDCALTGEECLPSPPHCGTPPPPEPAEAARNASAPLPIVAPIAGLSRFEFVPPERLFDTRTAAASARLVRSDGATSGPLSAERTGTFAHWTSLPPDATSVWLNLAAVPLTNSGFLRTYAAGSSPVTSTLNFDAPRVRSNAVAVALGDSGGVTFRASAGVNLIADWTGVFATEGLGLRIAGPQRVLDTRSAGTPLVAGTPFAVDVSAPSDALGVVASVAVIGGATGGFLQAYPCGAATPGTSHVNFAPASVSANTILSELGGGQLCFLSSQAAHVVVDVTGYLVPDGELSYQAIAPVRLLDTRSATSLYAGRLGARQVLELPIQGLPGMPADVRAVVANITSISPGSRGFVTAYPCGMSVPGTSSLNFDTDAPAAALTVSATGDGATGSGGLCVFASARTNLVVDVLGVWVPTPFAPPPLPPPVAIDPDADDEPLPADGSVGDVGSVGADAGVVDAPPARSMIGSGCSSTGASGADAGGAWGASLLVTLGIAWFARRRRR
jgi:hypothetical protein